MFRNKQGNLSVGKIILAAVAAILVLSIVFGSFVVIPAGHTGVVVTLTSSFTMRLSICTISCAKGILKWIPSCKT